MNKIIKKFGKFSSSPKKGDLVKIDPKYLEQNLKQNTDSMESYGINTDTHPGSLKNDKHFQEVLKRSRNGDVAKVTNYNTKDNYVNLIFDDGFEAGTEPEYLIIT